MTRVGSIPINPAAGGTARTNTAVPASANFRNALNTTAGGVRSVVGGIAPYIPGGAVVSTAINSAAGLVQGAAGAGGLGAGATGPLGMGGLGGMGGVGDGQSEMNNMLNLQRAINLETQQFTALSNVISSRHHATKTAIDNIR